MPTTTVVDTYVVDSLNDILVENPDDEGVDLVLTSVNFTLASYFEDLTLTGSTATNGTGNGSDNVIIGNSSNNTISGGAGDDTLDGGTGNDSMIGGNGDDVFIVNATGDVVSENEPSGKRCSAPTFCLTI